MSDRKGHYLKPGVKCTIPGVVFTVHCECHTSGDTRHPGRVIRTFARAHVMVSYRRRDRWSTVGPCTLETPELLRVWMHMHSLEHRNNWVVCSCASDVLTLTKWWEYVESRSVVWCAGLARGQDRMETGLPARAVLVSALVVRGVPDIIKWRYDNRNWTWVSGGQYYPGRVDGGCGGAPTGTCDTGTNSGRGAPDDSHGRTTVTGLHQTYLASLDWWKRHARTGWGCTIGQLSMGLLRTYCNRKDLCTHNCDVTHALERSSAFGGRSSVWFVGNIGELSDERIRDGNSVQTSAVARLSGPITQVDVRSMYPYLMRTEEYPVKLLSTRADVSVGTAVALSRDYGVIARCDLETHRAEYPLRRNDRTIYPLGRFVTTLTGPELLEAYSDGSLRQVFVLSYYKLGRPFSKLMDVLLSERERARRDGGLVDEMFIKLLANNLSGKLAQRTGVWQRVADYDTPKRWGEYWTLSATSGLRERLRYVCGLAWRWCPDAAGRGAYTAAYSYVTAYGRLMMRRIREVCPPDSVVSQSTDGLWLLCADNQLPVRVSALVGGAPGQLRIVGSARSARFFSPNHYVTDGQWTLAGFRMDAPYPGHGRIAHRIDTPLWSVRHDTAPDYCLSTRHNSMLKCEIEGGTVDSSGWVRPLRILSLDSTTF